MEIGKKMFQNAKEDIIRENHYKILKLIKLDIGLSLGVSYVLICISAYLVNFIKPPLPFLCFLISCVVSVLVGMFISKKINNIISREIDKISDDEVLGLLSPLELKKYQIKSGDEINYVNGFYFSESNLKFKMENISDDGRILLLKDMEDKFKEVTVRDFFTLDYQL